MIRINLLPGEERRRPGTTVTLKAGELVLPLAVLVAVALVVAGTAVSQFTRAENLQKSIARVDNESRVLAPQIERVNRLAQERAELDLRLGIISKLQKGRTQSVRLMDELARCIPEHMWINSVEQSDGANLAVEGTTLSNLVVSDLMSRLERSSLFANVELSVAERAEIDEHDVVRFRVTCQVTPDELAQ